jgi:carbon-monoxide dehydrogenase medium subunit
VKLATFDYHAPETVADVVALLHEHGDDAKILAGGQSLMPLMALRVAVPEVLVDINRVTGLDTLERVGDRLRVGALVRHRHVERMPGLASTCPMMADALAMIGHVAIRNRGTVVGSLTHADPAAEWPAIALALDAEITAVGPSGTRTIPADAFFETYLTNALADNEVATEVTFRLPRRRVGSSFKELARRHGDFAIAGAGAVVELDEVGAIAQARLVVIGAAATPLRIREAEAVLTGASPTREAFEEAAQIVHRSVSPRGDIQGSGEYRRAITRVIARRALQAAGARAQETLNPKGRSLDV